MLILGIDDNSHDLMLLGRTMREFGHETLLVSEGEEALRLVQERSPDIVIADYMMPDLDGLEVCRRLRKSEAGSRTYFLLVTGRSEPELLVEAFDAGVDDFVTKPFEPRILAARIKGGERVVHLQQRVEADRQTMAEQMTELRELTRKLRTAAMIDELTGLPNRRWAMKRLDAEWSFWERTGRPMGAILLDVDAFKAVNDEHGHDVGDLVLTQIAKVVERGVGELGETHRWGGEEFLVICCNTPPAECFAAAHELRKAVESSPIRGERFELRVTASLGVASTEGGFRGPQELVKAADDALLAAKRMGRNRVERA